MSRTLVQLRESVSRFLGDWLQITTSTNITTNNYIISSDLAAYHDGEFKDTHYALITSGNNSGVKRTIKDFKQFEQRLEVYGAALAAEAGNVTVEIHRFDSTDLNKAINQAVLDCYPLLAVPQILPNDHFDYWGSSSYPDYWRVSVVTAAKEGTTKHNGTYSAKVTRAGTDGYLYTAYSLGSSVLTNDYYDKLLALCGQHVKFSRWVYASSASQARLCIYCNDTDVWYSPYHSGGSSWELLEVEADVPSSSTEISFRCEVKTTDGSAYFDGPGRSDVGSITGLGYLSSLSADTDSLELIEDQGEALACMAGTIYLRRFARPVSANDVARYKQDAAELQGEAEKKLKRFGLPMSTTKVKFGWQGDMQ